MSTDDEILRRKQEELAHLHSQVVSSSYTAGRSTISEYNLAQDVHYIATNLLDFFDENLKNYEFIAFDDKQFCEALKALIKDKNALKMFLERVKIEKEEFLKLVVYVSPSCFTTNLVKYIKNHVLDKK